MTDKKKNKLTLVKVEESDDAAPDAALDAALDWLFREDEDLPAEEGKKPAVKKPSVKKVRPKRAGNK